MLQMDIAGVKRDITNVTLELPMGILSSLNADYDGDCLNIIALLLQSQKNMFTNLRPSSLVISKNNGKFNRDFSLIKDLRAGYYILNNETI